MMKPCFIIFCATLTSTALAGAGGNIGVLDDRRYGSLQDPLYSSIGRFTTQSGNACTAGFISENLVLTNRHCATLCTSTNKCSIRFWNGNKYVNTAVVTIVAIGEPGTTLDGRDWAILRTNDPNPNFKNLAQKSTTGPVNRGGYGGLRVIKDEEVQPLKALFKQTYDRYYEQECKTKEDPYSCLWQHFNDAAKAAGFEPLLGDSANFKVQQCNITGQHPRSNKMVTTDCDSAGGDSGAPLLRGNFIVGLNNSGPHSFFTDNESIGGNAVKTENFYTIAKSLMTINGRLPSSDNNSSHNNHLAQPPKPTTNQNNNHVQPPQPSSNTGNTNPVNTNNPAPNTPTPPSPPNTISTPPAEPVGTTPPPVDNPGIITDPEQIRRMLNQEIMNMECD